MKTTLIIICCLFALTSANAQVTRNEKGVTFVVDENLPTPEEYDKYAYYSGVNAARYWISESSASINSHKCIASSFANASLLISGRDVMFRCIEKAYAEHRPLVLSPDMVWLAICQGFGHYVNENAEKLRDLFVEHDGMVSLVVESKEDLKEGKPDWESIIKDFNAQIQENTKGDIAKVMVADFSTTGTTERIASGITMMDAMKSYFEYVVIRVSCGIPNITLTGTPADWESVLSRTMALEKYGLGWWTKDLRPILEEFVKASKGKPDQHFWKCIVMQDRPDRIRGGGCGPSEPTTFDGWFLKLFPYDKDGKRVNVVRSTTEMMPEMVRVDFKYIVIDDNSTKTIPMELWAGFVGIEEDKTTHALMPKIGWMVREADSEQDVLNQMTANSKEFNILRLRVKEVPEIIKNITSLDRIELIFTDKVVLPEWLKDVNIKSIVVRGEISKEEAEAYKEAFPNVKSPRFP